MGLLNIRLKKGMCEREGKKPLPEWKSSREKDEMRDWN